MSASRSEREPFANEWRMYRRKNGAQLYHRIAGTLNLAPRNLRYAVSCNPLDSTPHLFRRREILPHQGGEPNEMFVEIRCPRNVRFDTSDADPRQWSHATLPASGFFDLYEPLADALYYEPELEEE